MKEEAPLFDLSKLRVYPLAERRSLTRVEDILVDPRSEPPVAPAASTHARECAAQIREARASNAAVILMYGAHLLRNGAALLLDELMKAGWLTHLATNGAGTIHDWEYAWLGRSTEVVQENVAAGTFGTWDETGRYIHLALLAGGIRQKGYGEALGGFIEEDGTALPSAPELESALRDNPASEIAAG